MLKPKWNPDDRDEALIYCDSNSACEAIIKAPSAAELRNHDKREFSAKPWHGHGLWQ